MKRFLKIGFACAALIFIAIQFYRPSFSNPAIQPGQSIEETAEVPAEVQMLLSRSCNDCHSNKTLHPWYTQVAPVSWWLAGHIDEGRRELNFSEWGTYSAKKKNHKLEEICEMVDSGAMPLPSYLWMHGNAALSREQAKMICDWTNAERARTPVE